MNQMNCIMSSRANARSLGRQRYQSSMSETHLMQDAWLIVWCGAWVAGAPVQLQVMMEGESLFNDATAIVLFQGVAPRSPC